MAKRTTSTPTTSTIKREAVSAPKRSQRDVEVETAPQAAAKGESEAPKRVPRESAPQGATADVARRAYEKFVARGGAHGHDVEDWLAAEAEIRSGR